MWGSKPLEVQRPAIGYTFDWDSRTRCKAHPAVAPSITVQLMNRCPSLQYPSPHCCSGVRGPFRWVLGSTEKGPLASRAGCSQALRCVWAVGSVHVCPDACCKCVRVHIDVQATGVHLWLVLVRDFRAHSEMGTSEGAQSCPLGQYAVDPPNQTSGNSHNPCGESWPGIATVPV